MRPPKASAGSGTDGGAGAPAAPTDMSRLTDDEKRTLITRIDPLERKIGLAAAGLGAVLAVYANVPYMISKITVATTVAPKGKTCADGLKYVVSGGKATCNGVYPPSHYVLPLVVSLLLALAVYVTVRIGRRAPLAFATVMTGLSFGSYILVPFLVAGGWIMLRSYRAQKYGSPTAKARLPGYTPPTPRRFSGRSATSAGGRPSRRGAAPPPPGVRKPPPANKRYTPKAPPKKKATPPAT